MIGSAVKEEEIEKRKKREASKPVGSTPDDDDYDPDVKESKATRANTKSNVPKK